VNSERGQGDFFPREALVSWTSRTLVPGYTYREGQLPATLSGSEMISDVFGPEFNPYISKMTFIRGLDILQYLGHVSGIFGSITGEPYHSNTAADLAIKTATIDQVLAYSGKFYGAGFSGLRSLHYAPLNSGSVNVSLKKGAGGLLEAVPFVTDPSRAFTSLFNGFSGVSQNVASAGALVDKAVADYMSVKNNSRLSAFDRDRLEQHVQGLSDIKRRLNASAVCTASAPASSGGLKPWVSMSDGIKKAALFNDVLIAGFRCGLSRIGVLSTNDLAPEFTGTDRHQELWHRWDTPDAQSMIKRTLRSYSNAVLLDLVSKLSVETDADGRSMLDNTLIVLMPENAVPHDNRAMPVVTFGGGGGKFATGRYLDYRNLNAPLAHTNLRVGYASFIGVPMQLFFNGILQGFGLAPQDYEEVRQGVFAYGGYGAIYPDGDWNGGSNLLVDANNVTYKAIKKSQVLAEWSKSGVLAMADRTLPSFYKG